MKSQEEVTSTSQCYNCLLCLTCLLTLFTIYNTMLKLNLIHLDQTFVNKTNHLPAKTNNSYWIANVSDLPSQLYFRLSAARYDNRRKYKIHDFVVVGKKWDDSIKAQICLATQTSLDRFDSLGEVATQWQGLMSVAVFAPDEEFPLALRYIAYLQKCFSAVRDNVSFHVLYPETRPPVQCLQLKKKSVNLTCWKPDKSLHRLLQMRSSSMVDWREHVLYPQNHLRNVARKNCQSPYVFQTDVDIIPRRGLATSLSQFLQKPDVCQLCGFVVPTYEIDSHVDELPLTKERLMELVYEKLAQPFHKKLFSYSQRATDYSYWEDLLEIHELEPAYRVTRYQFLYEPFYVSTDLVPPHDERFIGFGFTRNTQINEMMVAGFRLWVFNNAFAMHRGMVRRRVNPIPRDKQIRSNSIRVHRFRKEVAAKYSRIRQYRRRRQPRPKN